MRVSHIFSAISAVALVGQQAAASPVDYSTKFDDIERGPGLTAELIAAGYEIFPATFTGDFGPDGETLSFNGTIEEVITQVHSINPVYKFNAPGRTIEARGDGDWKKVDLFRTDCEDGGWARSYWVDEGINYLRNVSKDTCKLSAPGCARVSCSWNSAIYVCWEPWKGSPSSYEKSWDYVADYAEGIIRGEWCPKIDKPRDTFTRALVRGKAWDPKGMAVHVARDKC